MGEWVGPVGGWVGERACEWVGGKAGERTSGWANGRTDEWMVGGVSGNMHTRAVELVGCSMRRLVGGRASRLLCTLKGFRLS